MAGSRLSPGERRFARLFFPVCLGFGGRMALVAFNGPLARIFTQNGYLIGLLLAMSPLVATFAHPTFGRLSDRTWTRFGRRTPYGLVGVPLTALVLFAIPSAPDYTSLLALFLLHALFASICSVPLLSLVPDVVDPRSRGRVMSLAMIGTGIGAIAIQVAGRLFWERDFAFVYYASALLLLVAAVPPLFWLREPSVGADESPPSQGRPLDALKGLPAILAFERPVALFLASAALRYLGTGLVLTYVTLFAVADLDIQVGDAALAIAASGLLRLALALPIGRLVDVRDRRKLLLLATWSTALVHLGTGIFVDALWQLYAVLALAGAAGVLEMAAGGPLFMDLMPDERRGEFTGVNLVLQNILRAVGALAGGALFAWTGSYRGVFPIAAICFALSALVLARSPRELRSPSVVAAGLDRPLP